MADAKFSDDFKKKTLELFPENKDLATAIATLDVVQVGQIISDTRTKLRRELGDVEPTKEQENRQQALVDLHQQWRDESKNLETPLSEIVKQRF